MICDAGDVAVVPFPFSERPGSKRRPALALSVRTFNRSGHTVLAMITTKTHAPWPGDRPIQDLDPAGLPRPCIVRMKLFTLDNRLILRKAGRLSDRDLGGVRAYLEQQLLPELR